MNAYMHLISNSSTQRVYALTSDGTLDFDFPPSDAMVGDIGIFWGKVEEIGSPAYWASQAWMWELDEPDHYQLGNSLEEEVMACLLGGYGIPAEIGLAAYDRFRAAMQTDPQSVCDPQRTYELLSEPLEMGARSVKYRFARQKSAYLAGAMSRLPEIDRSAGDKELRDQLVTLPGIGLKTASWIVRNWRRSDLVSILDIHIMRAGQGLNIFPKTWKVERNYRELEDAYLSFAHAISTRASILDSVMWMTMRSLSSSLTMPVHSKPTITKSAHQSSFAYN